MLWPKARENIRKTIVFSYVISIAIFLEVKVNVMWLKHTKESRKIVCSRTKPLGQRPLAEVNSVNIVNPLATNTVGYVPT